MTALHTIGGLVRNRLMEIGVEFRANSFDPLDAFAFQNVYRIGERVIRPALVRVAQ